MQLEFHLKPKFGTSILKLKQHFHLESNWFVGVLIEFEITIHMDLDMELQLKLILDLNLELQLIWDLLPLNVS